MSRRPRTSPARAASGNRPRPRSVALAARIEGDRFLGDQCAQQPMCRGLRQTRADREFGQARTFAAALGDHANQVECAPFVATYIVWRIFHQRCR